MKPVVRSTTFPQCYVESPWSALENLIFHGRRRARTWYCLIDEWNRSRGETRPGLFVLAWCFRRVQNVSSCAMHHWQSAKPRTRGAYGILIRGVKVTNGVTYIRTVIYILTSRTYIHVASNVCLLAGAPSSIPFLCPYLLVSLALGR